MTYRNRFHSQSMTCLATELEIWRRRQPEPRGQVLTGDAGVQLTDDPPNVYGVDVVYISAEVMACQTADRAIIAGVPVLAVEITSPSNTSEDIDEKLEAYMDAGVGAMWEVNPRRRTVTVHRPGCRPVLLTDADDLTGDPVLPGFRVPVAALFG